jgi:hypothetical protein
VGHSAKNDLSMEVLRDFCTRETFLWSVPGTLHKNRESGIWLKICKIIGIPARIWDSTLRITPDFFPIENYWEKLREIGSRLFPIFPDRQLTFPIIPSALGLVKNFRPAL